MGGLERGTVALEPYNCEWPDRYREEVERLRPIVGDRIREFEHVGSTAVEGLTAKPIIDILGAVSDLEAVTDLVPVLEAHGYEHRPDTDVPDRIFLAKGPRDDRTHYLSLTECGSNCYVDLVDFRDYLRSNPDVVAEYERLKRNLADAHPDDRETYTREKSAFVEGALEWARAHEERSRG